MLLLLSSTIATPHGTPTSSQTSTHSDNILKLRQTASSKNEALNGGRKRSVYGDGDPLKKLNKEKELSSLYCVGETKGVWELFIQI